jgi:hypothetical protein
MHNLSSVYELEICVTVHHQYSDVNNRQDATTLSIINLFKSAHHGSDGTSSVSTVKPVGSSVGALYQKLYIQ